MITIAGAIASLADAFGDIGMEELDKKMTEDRLAAGQEPLGPFVNPLDLSRLISLGASLGLSFTELGDSRKHKTAAQMIEAWHYTNNALVVKTIVRGAMAMSEGTSGTGLRKGAPPGGGSAGAIMTRTSGASAAKGMAPEPFVPNDDPEMYAGVVTG